MYRYDKGENVVLRSGGPVMTVTRQQTTLGPERFMVWCEWYESGVLQTQVFNTILLRRVPSYNWIADNSAFRRAWS
jgi:uncharacterized protein YodC (DUF2158 family)